MARMTQFILYQNYYLLIDFISNFGLLIKIFIENNVFELKIRHGTKKI